MNKKLWVTSTIFPQFMQSKIHSFTSNRFSAKFFLMKNIIWTPSKEPCIKLESMHSKHIKNALLLIEKFDYNYELSDYFTRDEWWSIFNMELFNRGEDCIEPKVLRNQRVKENKPTGTPISMDILNQLARISNDLNSIEREEKALENQKRKQELDYSNSLAIIAFKKVSLEEQLLYIQRKLS